MVRDSSYSQSLSEPGFRWLFRDLGEYLATRQDVPGEPIEAADTILLPGLRHMWRTIGFMQELGRPEAAEWPSDAIESLLCELYALSRIGDVLLAPFQEPNDLARPDVWNLVRSDVWHELPEHAAYSRFCEALEMTRVDERTFHPFFHEIVTVEIADGLEADVELVDEVWPGYMLGCLLFTRAGVRVRARAESLSTSAARSPLYFSWWRRNRFTIDASHWWHNDKSQWDTEFRRDYALPDRLLYNVDGDRDLDAPFLDDEPSSPSREERLELLRFRHRLRSEGSERDEEEDEWWWAEISQELSPSRICQMVGAPSS